MPETLWDSLQYLRRILGVAPTETPPEYDQKTKDRLERNAFHQRMRQRQFPEEVTAGNDTYHPSTHAEFMALEEAKNQQDQYLARKELYRETGDPGLLENAGGSGQPTVLPFETPNARFSNTREGLLRRKLEGEPEFVQRMYSKDPPMLGNGDGSYSTHSMASARVGNMEIAYPTVINVDGKLVRLSDEEALSHAIKTGEYKRFPTQKDADIYARGAWKDGLDQSYREDQ
jgi:hypothetical protein